VKTLSSALKGKLRGINPSSLLNSGLLGLVLILYIYVVYAIIITLGTFPLGREPDLSLIQTSRHWLINSVTLLCLALTIVPVGRWLQTHVNDLVFGQEGNPFALPSMISQRLRGMQNPQLSLPPIVESIAKSLHLPYVAIELGGDDRNAFTYGSPQTQATNHMFPIQHLDQPLGRLIVSSRSAGYPLAQSDHHILQEIALQIGVALHLASMTEVLQTSREEIIVAREEERRHIRNDLHDGLAPTLSSFQLQLGAIRKLMFDDPEQAGIILQDLSGDLKHATGEIRELVYHLRPPTLDELGLIGAIQNLDMLDSDLQLKLDAPDPLPPISAATEVAIFRIVTEALHNVAKHAEATICVVSLATDPEVLVLTITDNGRGMPTDYSNGVGLHSMRERAAELGGTFSIQPANPSGTCIEVRLPWRDAKSTT
jgi:two-component system NarL family sensor kinase